MLDGVTKQGAPSAQDLAKFKALEFGRFSEGAALRAQAIASERAIRSFNILTMAVKEAEKPAASTAAR